MTAAVERFISRRHLISRDGKTSSLELRYLVTGTTSHQAAALVVKAATPDTDGVNPTLYRQSILVEDAGASGTWEATVQYDSTAPEPFSANDSFEFDTTGSTQRITQSLETIGRYPANAPDFGGAIGVSDNGVEGVDITVPGLVFAETHFFAEVTPAAKVMLSELTGSINLYPWHGRDAGEILFLGARLRKDDNRESTPWVVTYQFAVQPNRGTFFVGDIEVPGKVGWDYMWIRYAKAVDEVSSTLVQVPQSVHIERVYPAADFAALGIGP